MRIVPMTDWGKDHWSMLAYIETRCVDYKGTIELERVRCNLRRHPGLWSHLGRLPPPSPHEPYKHGTRLREGVVEEHDDWDCFYDIEAAGLIEDKGTGINPVAKLTTAGVAMAAKVREWKSLGGSFGDFNPTKSS